MKYEWAWIDYKLKELSPNYIPIEELTAEEQEEAWDRIFDNDWGYDEE